MFGILIEDIPTGDLPTMLTREWQVVSVAPAGESTKAKGDYYIVAAGIAEKIAPYRHPRLSAVKVGADRTNTLNIPDDITAQELRAEILSDVIRFGVLPIELTRLLPEPQQLLGPGGVADRAHNGRGGE